MSLTVVGLGICVAQHVTIEARACLETADEVLHLAADPVGDLWIAQLNPQSRSLSGLFTEGRDRREAYAAIVNDVLARLRQGGNVCFALYGHPGVFADPGHEAVRRARSEGIPARMLPAVSAEDCLFADLGIDPGASGCQSYDATDLVVRRPTLDSSAALVVWQPAIVGRRDYAPEGDASSLPQLVEYLEGYYATDHEVVCYAASPYSLVRPVVKRVALSALVDMELPRLSLLYLPPASERNYDGAGEAEPAAFI